jgi:outer membrane protein TolC
VVLCLLTAAKSLVRDGLITYLDVATAENTELTVEFRTVRIRGQQLVATVALVQALGGGWQERAKQWQ